MNNAWKAIKNDFNAMSDEEIEREVSAAERNLEEAEEWLEAVASWKAAGKPREGSPMVDAPKKIWIDRDHGKHPDDWSFDSDKTLFSKRMLELEKVEYTRSDLVAELAAENDSNRKSAEHFTGLAEIRFQQIREQATEIERLKKELADEQRITAMLVSHCAADQGEPDLLVSEWRSLAAENERLHARNLEHEMRLEAEEAKSEYWKNRATTLASTGAVNVSAIRAELRRLESFGDLAVWETYDDRGLTIDEYVELFTQVISAIDPTPPEGQQEPVAERGVDFVNAINNGTVRINKEMVPEYTRPSEQAVTDEMVDAAYEKVRRMPASVDTADGDLDTIIRSALKAAMEQDMTDAREIIAQVFRRAHRDACYPDASTGECEIAASAIADALTAAGFRIIGKDEVDQVTLELAADAAEELAEWVPLKAGDMRTAIRAIGRKA